MQGIGKGGALFLVLIVQATAEEVHRISCKQIHKPRLSWSDALLQGPAVGKTSGSRFSEPNTAIRSPAPSSAVTRRHEEEAAGRRGPRTAPISRRAESVIGFPLSHANFILLHAEKSQISSGGKLKLHNTKAPIKFPL